MEVGLTTISIPGSQGWQIRDKGDFYYSEGSWDSIFGSCQTTPRLRLTNKSLKGSSAGEGWFNLTRWSITLVKVICNFFYHQEVGAKEWERKRLLLSPSLEDVFEQTVNSVWSTLWYRHQNPGRSWAFSVCRSKLQTSLLSIYQIG